MTQTGRNPEGRGRGTLGTFAGVFTPSVLTILGIILFLRLGFVTGAAGALRALAIIGMANAISVLTSISLSAIATNLRVKGGGDYYLISRTLGVEYGGALGLVLYLAQSVSIAFYAIGLGEAVAAMGPAGPSWVAQAIAAVAVAGLFVVAWKGADLATRFQYVVMAVLGAAVLAFFIGGIPDWSAQRVADNLAPAMVPASHDGGGTTLGFWTVFALFFPAVTGFTQGVSMSGDLKDAGRSLPLGTFLAVGVSMVVYVATMIVFAGTLPNADLVADYGAMRRVSFFPWLVDAGVIAATLSSALASFLGAPRILQSLASDRVFPVLGYFAVGHGETGNPRRGVLLSATIAFGTIALGNLNFIAPIVSMFFLISYGLLNYATYVEAHASSPSFRPRFRWFHEKLSLAGAVSCFAVMLAIHATAAVVAVVLLFAIYHYLARNVAVERWADSDRSQRFQRIREDLRAIALSPEHARYWRPVLLAVSDDPERGRRLLRFASWLEGRSGLTSLVRLVEGSGRQARRVRREIEGSLRDEIRLHDLPAFPRAIVTGNPDEAFPVLLQSYGLGPVRANTLLLSWVDEREREGSRRFADLVGRLRVGLRLGLNLVVLSARSGDFTAVEETPPRKRIIDVWHRDNATGRLMLLLAYLMTRTEEWEDARIRLFAPPTAGRTADERRAELEQMLDDVRIVAELELVETTDAGTVAYHSSDASVVFLPMSVTGEAPTSVYGRPDELLPAVGLGALVLACEDIDLDAEPEEGRHAEIALAADDSAKAARASRKASDAAEKATAALIKKREALAKARADNAGDETLADLESAALSAEVEVEHLKRRAAKARAKAELAAREVERLAGKPAGPEQDAADGAENSRE